jgi:hypothetical protein
MKNNLSTSHTAFEAKKKKTGVETSMRTNLGEKTTLNFGCMFLFHYFQCTIFILTSHFIPSFAKTGTQ